LRFVAASRKLAGLQGNRRPRHCNRSHSAVTSKPVHRVGCWSFPPSPLVLWHPCGHWYFRGIESLARGPVRENLTRHPHDLYLFFEDISSAYAARLLNSFPKESDGPSNSSYGVVKYPSAEKSPLRPVQVQAPSVKCRQTPHIFRPCRSSRLRRFTPQRTAQVCCTLNPALGSLRFQLPSGSLSRTLLKPFPKRLSHPSKLFPQMQPATRHRATFALSSFPSDSAAPSMCQVAPTHFRFASLETPTSRLYSASKSVAAMTPLPVSRARCSLGLSPSPRLSPR
jgi:hypothetical protein